jgi:hypothetical protein
MAHPFSLRYQSADYGLFSSRVTFPRQRLAERSASLAAFVPEA